MARDKNAFIEQIGQRWAKFSAVLPKGKRSFRRAAGLAAAAGFFAVTFLSCQKNSEKSKAATANEKHATAAGSVNQSPNALTQDGRHKDSSAASPRANSAPETTVFETTDTVITKPVKAVAKRVATAKSVSNKTTEQQDAIVAQTIILPDDINMPGVASDYIVPPADQIVQTGDMETGNMVTTDTASTSLFSNDDIAVTPVVINTAAPLTLRVGARKKSVTYPYKQHMLFYNNAKKDTVCYHVYGPKGAEHRVTVPDKQLAESDPDKYARKVEDFNARTAELKNQLEKKRAQINKKNERSIQLQKDKEVILQPPVAAVGPGYWENSTSTAGTRFQYAYKPN